MLDIVEIPQGRDLGVADSAVSKAANILGTQLGSLEYAPTFGCDLKYFLNSKFQIQNESFKAYLVGRLTDFFVNASEVLDVLNPLYEKFTFFVDDSSTNVGRGLIE